MVTEVSPNVADQRGHDHAKRFPLAALESRRVWFLPFISALRARKVLTLYPPSLGYERDLETPVKVVRAPCSTFS